MSYVVGSPITGTIWPRDNSNVAITGATFAGANDILEAFDEDGTAATLTITEINAGTNPGAYRWTFTPTTSGKDWTGHIVYDNNGVRREWSEDYRVVTAAQADPAAALVAQNLTVDAPLATEADKAVVAGDAATLAWSSTGWPDLTGETATLQAYKTLTDTAVFASAKAVTIANAGQATQNLSLALLGADTDDFTPGIAYRYEVNSTVGTLVSGTLSAREG